MRIVQPWFEIEELPEGIEILRRIESYGRTAYKSEDKITDESARAFIKRLLGRRHLSVIEHVSVTVRIICDRGVSHELVRHRIASYTQESTRFCNYNSSKFGNEITVIEPYFRQSAGIMSNELFATWGRAIEHAEAAYNELIDLGATPQEARSVLPNSLKTEIVVTMNLRQWRHFFKLRTAKDAHPQMRQITVPLLEAFQEKIPVIFSDIDTDDAE
jgi:thymidylate synthase (FAD)